MKKCLFLFLFVFLGGRIYAQLGYWFQDRLIQLESNDSSQYYVQLICKNDIKDDSISYVKNLVKSDSVLPICQNGFLVKASERPVSQKIYVSDIYHSPVSDYIIILPSISFEMVEGSSSSEILKKYSDVVSLKAIEGNVYRLVCNVSTSKEILEIALQIYKEKNVKWCEPLKLSRWSSQNPMYSQQYYLKNTGQGNGSIGIDINVEPAWDLISGSSNITVAVIDEGIDSDHEDLSNSVLSGYTVRNPTGYGIPQLTNVYEKGHGVACAGIIAAEDNNKGIKGVASGIKLLPINIVPDSGFYDFDGNLHQGFANDEEIAKAIVWASSRADILSCSWGGGAYSQDIVNAIDTAMAFGRNGKGCVVIFSSGNGYHIGNNYVNFPACINGVIAVGAIDNSGNVWYYSQRGNELDLVAPSGDIDFTGDIITTDRMGNLGYNPSAGGTTDLSNTNYTQRFGGTSAACPQVAGVVALMLSANPNLTVNQIRSILHNTARNLGASGFDTTYGYGLVDAYAAVNSAINAYGFSIVGTENPCGSAIYSIANLPSGYTVEWSLPSDLSSIITTDYPQANQCTITNNGTILFDTYLTALIKNSAGQTLKSLIKRVRSTFDITFHQTGTTYNGVTYPSIPNSTVKSNQTIIVNHMCRVFLDSPYFSGMTVSHTGASHQFWNMIDGVSFKFSPVTTTETMMITGSDGCHMINLQVLVTPNENIPVPMLTAIGTSSGYDIMLSMKYEDEDMAIRSQDILDDMTEWDISVTNIMTTNRVYSSRVRGKSIFINTIGWKSGVYIVEGVVNGQKAQCKIVVK